MKRETEKLCKAVSWLMFLGLCVLSAYFMYEVLDQYFSKDTSFKVTEEPLTNYPTITICFTRRKESWKDLLSIESQFDNLLGKGSFEYGKDFNISIGASLLVKGDNYIVGINETVTVESVANLFIGMCYKVTHKYSGGRFEPLSEMWHLTFNKAIHNDDLPTARLFFYI